MAIAWAERFEDGDISDWTLSGDYGELGLVTHPVRGGYGLRMANGSTGSSDRLARRTLSQAYTPTALSFEVFQEARGSDDVAFISFWKSAGVSRLLDFVLSRQTATDAARRCRVNGVYTVTFDVGSWIRVELTSIDYVAETFDIELFENGVSVYSDTGVAHSASGCDEIGMFQMGNQHGDDTGAWVLDNVLLGAVVSPDQPDAPDAAPDADSVALTGSAFSDSDVGDTHRATQWQIDELADSDYATPVVDTGDLSRAVYIPTNTQLTAGTFTISDADGLTLLAWARFRDLSGSGNSTILPYFYGTSASVRFQMYDGNLRWSYVNQTGGGRTGNVRSMHAMWADQWLLLALVLPEGSPAEIYIYGMDGSQLVGTTDAGNDVVAIPTTFNTGAKLGYENSSPGHDAFDMGQIQLVARAVSTANLADWAENGLDWSDADLIDGYRFEGSLASVNGVLPTWSGSPAYPSDTVYPDAREGQDLTSYDSGAGSLDGGYVAHVRYQERYSGAWSPYSDDVSFYTNLPPDQPTISSVSYEPGTGHVGLLTTVVGSAFSDPQPPGDTQKAAQWQIDVSSGDFSSPVYDSGADTTNLTTLDGVTAGLDYATAYQVRVRHQDVTNDEWSDWSAAYAFTTPGGWTKDFSDPSTDQWAKDFSDPNTDVWESDI